LSGWKPAGHNGWGGAFCWFWHWKLPWVLMQIWVSESQLCNSSSHSLTSEINVIAWLQRNFLQYHLTLKYTKCHGFPELYTRRCLIVLMH
jgi:hypothetical protein